MTFKINILTEQSSGYPNNHNSVPIIRRRRLVRDSIPFNKVSLLPSLYFPVLAPDEYHSCAFQPLTGKLYTQFSSKVSLPLKMSRLSEQSMTDSPVVGIHHLLRNLRIGLSHLWRCLFIEHAYYRSSNSRSWRCWTSEWWIHYLSFYSNKRSTTSYVTLPPQKKDFS